jgi:uncharacterized damage-inducible protein DinB
MVLARRKITGHAVSRQRVTGQVPVLPVSLFGAVLEANNRLEVTLDSAPQPKHYVEEEKRMANMYTDMSERDLIKWTLDYTMPWIIDTFEAISDERICIRPREHINSAGWIFGHIAVKERIHIAGFAQGFNDIPGEFHMFHGFPPPPTEEQLREVIKSKETLIDYWRKVRQQTHEYLDRLSDADLKKVPEKSVIRDGEPNRDNPIREFFVMTIQHQNCHWGQLQIIQKLWEENT